MADRMAAKIQIGGSVPVSVIDEFVAEIVQSGAGLDWGDSFMPEDIFEVLEAAESGVLVLCHDQACYGEFSDLETFLVKHGIGFDRYTYEYDAEIVRFRPGMVRPVAIASTQDEREVVPKTDLFPVLDALEIGNLQEATARLQTVLGPTIPPLTPLCVVEGR